MYVCMHLLVACVHMSIVYGVVFHDNKHVVTCIYAPRYVLCVRVFSQQTYVVTCVCALRYVLCVHVFSLSVSLCVCMYVCMHVFMYVNPHLSYMHSNLHIYENVKTDRH
jgi:hypothetical protein